MLFRFTGQWNSLFVCRSWRIEKYRAENLYRKISQDILGKKDHIADAVRRRVSNDI